MCEIPQRLERQLCRLGVEWRGYVENAYRLPQKGLGDSNAMPDFSRPAERARESGGGKTMCSGDKAGDACAREQTSHRPRSDRSQSVCDRLKPKYRPELIDPISLHANAILLEARRPADAGYVTRHAFRRNELCKDFSGGLIREPGDHVGVITECHC